LKQSHSLCQRLGIKQEDMAVYLGVSVDTMSQYEIYRRSLPSGANIKLLNLEILLAEKTRPLVREDTGEDMSHFGNEAQHLPGNAMQEGTHYFHSTAHREKTQKILQRHAANCRHKAYLAERKLELMQHKFNQAQQLLLVMEALKEKEPPESIDTSWIHVMRQAALKKLDQNGLPAQTKCRLRLLSMQQQEKIAGQMDQDLQDYRM